MKTEKPRLDQLLTERGLAPTRARAQALVMAGLVLVDGKPADKAGVRVSPDAAITLKDDDATRWASRGAGKLSPALDTFSVETNAKTCLDVGASTGGFTDVLLTRGARRVYAVDVGKGLLYWRLRQDSRVTVMEEVNARYLKPADLPEPIDLAVIDVSFISLTLILPAVAPLLAPGGEVVAMVKPQFEVGKEKIGKGVVRDPAAIAAAVDKVSECATGLGLVEVGRAASEVKGPKGNQEVFVHLRRK